MSLSLWYAAATAFLIAALLTPLLRHLSHRHGLLDVPNDRSSHAIPTPRTGGVAMALGLIVVFALFGDWRDARLVAILGGSLLIGLLGLVDDIRSLAAGSRLLVHVGTAAAVVALAALSLKAFSVPFVGELKPGSLGFAFSLLWLVAVTNAFNFMDGINGLASVEAIFCASTYAVLLAVQGDTAAALLGAAVAGAAFGFLPFNLPSGSIFMGDVGSGLLGFVLAALGLRLSSSGIPFPAILLPLLPFLFDSGVTLLRRALRRERLFSAHRTHFYQRLTDLGWSHTRVTLLWATLAAVCCACALAWMRVSETSQLAMLVAVVMLHVAVAVFVMSGHRRLKSSPAR